MNVVSICLFIHPSARLHVSLFPLTLMRLVDLYDYRFAAERLQHGARSYRLISPDAVLHAGIGAQHQERVASC